MSIEKIGTPEEKTHEGERLPNFADLGLDGEQVKMASSAVLRERSVLGARARVLLFTTVSALCLASPAESRGSSGRNDVRNFFLGFNRFNQESIAIEQKGRLDMQIAEIETAKREAEAARRAGLAEINRIYADAKLDALINGSFEVPKIEYNHDERGIPSVRIANDDAEKQDIVFKKGTGDANAPGREKEDIEVDIEKERLEMEEEIAHKEIAISQAKTEGDKADLKKNIATSKKKHGLAIAKLKAELAKFGKKERNATSSRAETSRIAGNISSAENQRIDAARNAERERFTSLVQSAIERLRGIVEQLRVEKRLVEEKTRARHGTTPW